MADNSARVAKMARILAIAHIIVGFLLLCFGIADRAVEYFWTGDGGFGIWIGVWMCVAGGLGIPGTGRDRSTSRNALAGVFMGFSITSAVFGGVVIVCYSTAIASYSDEYRDYYDYDYDYDYDDWGQYNRYSDRYNNYDAQMAIGAIILIIGIVEFAIGIWAAVCICLMKPCTCRYPPQQDQMMYTANSGYAMTQCPVGGSVPAPVQAGGGMYASQAVTPSSQEGQPQMVMAPVSGAMGNEPPFVQVVTSGAMATGYQPQQAAIPTSYEHGYRGYIGIPNQQMPVNT